MKIKQIITIADFSGKTVYELDFQDLPNDYRVRRVDRLMKKYPTDQYVWHAFIDQDRAAGQTTSNYHI